MGNLVAAYRRHPHHVAPISQGIVGHWAGMSQAQISRMETGQPELNIDRLRFWARLLDIPGHVLWFESASSSGSAVAAGGAGQSPAIEDRFTALGAVGSSEPPGDLDGLLFDSIEAIDHRRRRAAETHVDDALLSYVDAEIRQIIDTYEQRPPMQLAPHVRGLRARVEDLLDQRQLPRQREQLYAAAARLSCIHGVLALDAGRFRVASQYGAEAFTLAEAVRQPDLQAWVRAGQSLVAYYSGQYHDALAFARDGFVRAPHGPQAVRLAINGEARAHARLGNSWGVDDAVGRGLAALDDHRRDTVSPSLALEPYCEARAAANAATAYLLLGRYEDAATHARLSLAAFDRAELHGPRALSRLDLATAELQRPSRDVDLEYACAVAVEALTLTTGHAFESVTLRTSEFLTSARHWSGHAGVQQVASLLEQRNSRALPALPFTP
ncbi:helix-turn-helix transcriptional regulator [Dactylosporangium sp. NPDC051485]|uniref:helix-turn-helix transcriptional regulator n=1 Tax=Dactylosporangium sp. NPDC051485 TaxID=3154846 RepID=UPI0034306776